jgi:hypothetical protein
VTVWSVLCIDALEDIVNDKALANSAVTIVVLDIIICPADAVQLICVAVVVRTILLADQYNCDVGPGLSEKP